jgi:hypothetical protein
VNAYDPDHLPTEQHELHRINAELSTVQFLVPSRLLSNILDDHSGQTSAKADGETESTPFPFCGAGYKGVPPLEELS